MGNQKRSVLSARQEKVLETVVMRLTEKQALAYLEELGFKISGDTWRRDRRILKTKTMKRLYHIALIGFEEQHILRIDKCEQIEKQMWQNYHNETDFYKRTLILEKIVKMQPYLSAYYEASRKVLKDSSKPIPENPNIPTDGSGSDDRGTDEEPKTDNSVVPRDEPKDV